MLNETMKERFVAGLGEQVCRTSLVHAPRMLSVCTGSASVQLLRLTVSVSKTEGMRTTAGHAFRQLLRRRRADGAVAQEGSLILPGCF